MCMKYLYNIWLNPDALIHFSSMYYIYHTGQKVHQLSVLLTWLQKQNKCVCVCVRERGGWGGGGGD